jgi:ribose-phosphate pyrophosphokinase
MTVIGEVEGKNVVLIDDMIDTAGTITKAAELIMEKKALSVRCLATHALFSGPAIERINNSPLLEVIVTDSVPLCKHSEKIRVVSIAEMFADVIKKVYYNQSISSSFIF